MSLDASRTLGAGSYEIRLFKPGFDALGIVVDFIPGTAPYDRIDTVEFIAVPKGTKMVFTSAGMHDEQWNQMAIQGFESSLVKLSRILEA